MYKENVKWVEYNSIACFSVDIVLILLRNFSFFFTCVCTKSNQFLRNPDDFC